MEFDGRDGPAAAAARDAADLGSLVRLVANREASSRSDLARLTGLSRSTVSQRVDALLRRGLLIETGPGPSTGGRRPVLLSLNPGAGLILAACLGATHGRLAQASLGGEVQRELAGPLDIAGGPAPVMSWIVSGFREMLRDSGHGPADVRAIGVSVPGPVEFATGTVVHPPIMPGWDGAAIPELLREHFAAPVVVDNDVNVMALGEYQAGASAGSPEMLVVKVGTGIGCGIITHGVLHRGADGAAGDIGHVRLAGQDDTVCVCGNTGCLEAVASGSAVAAGLRADGIDARDARDVVRLAQTRDPMVQQRVRAAGQRIGEVLAALVNFYNPDTIIIGGALAELRNELLASIRGVIYSRALPLATRHLTISVTSPGLDAGLTGTLALARQAALSHGAMYRRGAPTAEPAPAE